MLPGFRILFGTVILSVSLLIFALGAAALLRSAHDNFASQPNWRSSVDVATLLTTAPAPAAPSLAMLRVEPELPKETASKPAMEMPPPAGPTPSVRPPAEAKMDAPVADTLAAEKPPVTKALNAAPVTEPASLPTESSAAKSVQRPSDPSLVDALKSEPKQDKVAALTASEEPKPAPTMTAALEPSRPTEAQAPENAATLKVEASLRDEPAAADQTFMSKKTEQANSSADGGDKPSEVAMLHEPVVPLSEIKLPRPRIDPQVTQARRQQRIVADRRAKARAIARRAAARARVTPFGQSAQTSSNSFQTTQQPFTQPR